VSRDNCLRMLLILASLKLITTAHVQVQRDKEIKGAENLLLRVAQKENNISRKLPCLFHAG